MVENHLEIIITDLISDMVCRIKDINILKTIVEIYFTIVSRGKGRLGMKIREGLQNLVNEEVSIIDKELCEYIERMLALHKAKMIQNGIWNVAISWFNVFLLFTLWLSRNVNNI